MMLSPALKKSNNQCVIKLVEKSGIRILDENNLLDGAEDYVAMCLAHFFSSLKNMLDETKSLSFLDIKILKSIGILKSQNLNYGYYKKERKEIKNTYKNDIINFICESETIHFDSVQEYSSLIKGYVHQFSSWENCFNLNLAFWMKDEINPIEYHKNWLNIFS